MSRCSTIYGYDLSYFTRKMEAAFQFHGMPFRRRSKTVFNRRRLERRSGTQKVPVVFAPDGGVLSDTTPIIDHLDRLDPYRRLFPEGLNGVVVRLVEEWLDEWFPRTVVHYRWLDPAGRDFAGRALAKELLPWIPGPPRARLAHRIARWGTRACAAMGVGAYSDRSAVHAEARAVWGALDEQLARTRYALGDRATAVDAVLLGALRGHYLTDPEPRKLLKEVPHVVAWAQRSGEWDGGGSLPDFPACGGFAEVILNRMRGPYGSWVLAHTAAMDRGDRDFEVDMGGRRVRFRVLRPPSPTDSLRYLNARIGQQVQGHDRHLLWSWVESKGLGDIVTVDGSGWT